MDLYSQRLNYKINPLEQKYTKAMEEKMKYSYATFNDIQTPSWSSLIKSEISQRNTRRDTHREKPKIQPLTQSNLEERLNQDHPVHLHGIKPIVRKNFETFQNQSQHKYETKDTATIPKVITHKVAQKIPEKDNKRFNHITVHEHLYLNSHKRQYQRMIERQIDEEYKKREVCPFQPTINKKSTILAESKFSRIKEKQYSAQKDEDRVETRATFQEKDSKEVERYKLLNKTFYFLTGNDSLLMKKGIQEKLQQLPLSTIKVLEPIIQQLYRDKVFQWIDFLQLFNSKAVKQKESFFSVMKKWFQRHQSFCQ